MNIRFANLAASLSLALVVSGTSLAEEAAPRPKYGAQATRLFHSQDYVRKNPAPDFWALMPYYAAQQDAKSCSVGSVTMIVNAARANQELTAPDELATQSAVLKKVKSKIWNKGLGPTGKGVALDDLGKLVEQSLTAYGLKGVTAQVVHADDTSAEMKTKLHQALVQNEKSANDFIIVNFLQSEYTGDPEGAVGHIAPVAAYDEKNKRVLVFDPDRQYYEPYWVSEEVLLAGMATRDTTSKKTRGYVFVSFAPMAK